jgi:hypothetical protein
MGIAYSKTSPAEKDVRYRDRPLRPAIQSFPHILCHTHDTLPKIPPLPRPSPETFTGFAGLSA